MAINETLKQKIDELDLDRRFNDAVETIERTIASALDRASDYTVGHRNDLESWIERAGTTVTERTEGRFAEPVAKAQARARLAVERLAARREADPEAGPEAGSDPDGPTA